MADAPEIKVKLTAEDTGVSAAIKELTSQLKNLKKQQDETASSGLSLKNAFTGIASAAVAIGLARIGKEAFDSAVDIGKMADKTGLTTQTLSVFHHVAEEAGVSTETVDKALIKAAKSITEFQLGTGKAAAGFKLLGITQKDFAGLKPDEKIALVTTKLGQMGAGFQKTTAAQLIFSKSGAEFIPIANAVAGEGFGNITASVAKLGLLLDQTTTDSFRAAKASMQELSDVGAGMATQFEAGLLPAISDIGDALLDSTLKGGDGFKEIGKVAGTAIKGIAFAFFAFGDSVGAIVVDIENSFGGLWDELKIGGTAVFEALGKAAHGDLAGAYKELTDGVRDFQKTDEDAANRHKAIWDQTAIDIRKKQEDLFLSDPDEARKNKERIARLRPDKQTEAAEPTPDLKPTDAAAKAALSLLEKQLQDELAIHRAYAKQAEQIDTEQYDKAEISVKAYFDRRRAEVAADVGEEIAILRRGIALSEAEAQKAVVAKKSAATPKEADKQEGVRLQALTKVQELQTKISVLEIESKTKIHALDTEEFKKREENDNKVLAFQKEIAVLQGKQEEMTRADIAMESEKLRIQLAQAGQSKEQIDQEIAQFTQLKTAQNEFKDAEANLQRDEKAFAIDKQSIEIRARAGQISSAEKEKEINDLIRDRLPLLRADAAAEMGAAQKTGNQDNVGAAQTATQGVDNLSVRTNELQMQVRGSLTNDFNTFFMGIGRSTSTVADQFRQLAASIVQSLEQIILKKMLLKMLGGDGSNSDGGGSGGGGGGLFGGLFKMFGMAEGGLINGPGGPKADAIPARLSAGEYVVKADAVSAFGVHNLEAINRGLKIPSLGQLSLPKFAEGGLVGNAGMGGGDSNINLGIGLDEGLILKHLSSKAARNIILQHIVNNPKAAGKGLSRSD